MDSCSLCGKAFEEAEPGQVHEYTSMADGRRFPQPLRFIFHLRCNFRRIDDPAHRVMSKAYLAAVREHFPEETTSTGQ